MGSHTHVLYSPATGVRATGDETVEVDGREQEVPGKDMFRVAGDSCTDALIRGTMFSSKCSMAMEEMSRSSCSIS